MEHEKKGQRGYKPERKVAVRKDVVSGKQEWEVSYHMTEPRRISMCERIELVDKVVTLMSEVQTVFPSAEVFLIFMTE